MLSQNIKKYRKENNMSQDELAEKIGVSRQSISLWETDQTQPTIDNVIALSKIFNVSSDILLSEGVADNNSQQKQNPDKPQKQSHIITIIVILFILAMMVAGAILVIPKIKNGNSNKTVSYNNISVSENLPYSQVSNTSKVSSKSNANKTKFDLFSYCKDFAINKGTLNGDFTFYQQDAKKYGGYDNEYFSISYWADSNMVEFALHCPLSDTQSINFYLRMRGEYNKKYEYLSSKYYRDTGESIRYATGYIDPNEFYDGYPISCDLYEGSADGQNQFMEETRVGICDLINCLKKFVEVEKMECEFSDFDFVNF